MTYEKFDEKELILRDHLAKDRTVLANERTLLSYIRTSLALFIVWVTFIKFFEDAVYQGIGWGALVLGLGILAVGTYKYFHMKKDIGGTFGSKRP